MARTPADDPAISYYDETNQQLLYIERTGPNWPVAPQLIDSGGVGEHTSLGSDPNSGDPVISHLDRTNYDITLARVNSAQTKGDVHAAPMAGVRFDAGHPLGTSPGAIAFSLVAQVYSWFCLDQARIPFSDQPSGGPGLITPVRIHW